MHVTEVRVVATRILSPHCVLNSKRTICRAVLEAAPRWGWQCRQSAKVDVDKQPADYARCVG